MTDDEIREVGKEVVHKYNLRSRRVGVIIGLALLATGIGLFFTANKARENTSRVQRVQEKASVTDAKAVVAGRKAVTAKQQATRTKQLVTKIVKVNGLRGVAGVSGHNGRQGIRGPRGPAGPVGPAGRAATVGELASALTIACGGSCRGKDAPAVTREDLLAVLESYCAVHGCKGEPGPPGPMGPMGLRGPAAPPAFCDPNLGYVCQP